jgi:hypothetical protein
VELRAVFSPDDSYNKTSKINESITEPEQPQAEDKVWSSESMLYIRTTKSGSIARIYKPDGALYEQRTIITEGTTKIKLPQGIYIVILNNGIGEKVRIE